MLDSNAPQTSENPKPGLNWTQEELDFLIANRTKMSLSQIGAKLHKSRSAVAGKSRRLGIQIAPGQARKRVLKPKEERVFKAKRVTLVKIEQDGDWKPIATTFKRGTKAIPKHMMEPPVGILNGVGVKLWELEANHCKWVIGEPSDLTCCGQNRHPDSPYCQDHSRIAYKGKPNG